MTAAAASTEVANDASATQTRAAEPMRVCVALPGLHRVFRGAETALEEIAKGLAGLGHDVTLIGSGEPIAGRPYRFIHAGCVPREKLRKLPRFPYVRTDYAWEELSFAPHLWRRYDPRAYDVTVTCGYPYTNWVLRRPAAGGRPPHVYVTQNGDWMCFAKSWEYKHFNCDGLVCTNHQYFERHKERYRATLIPNGVNPAVFFPAEADRAAYGLPEGRPVVLMVSALIPSKRVIEGIRAAARVPDVFFAVAGDGELREQVRAIGGELMPGRFLHLTLPRERMPGLYRCADVFLHMSQDEPSANAYMEALATGLPIVTHDWDVTRWTLEDQAILVNGSDEAAVAAGIERALTLKSTDQIAARRALIARRFSWSSIAQSYSEFFAQVRNPRR